MTSFDSLPQNFESQRHVADVDLPEGKVRYLNGVTMIGDVGSGLSLHIEPGQPKIVFFWLYAQAKRRDVDGQVKGFAEQYLVAITQRRMLNLAQQCCGDVRFGKANRAYLEGELVTKSSPGPDGIMRTMMIIEPAGTDAKFIILDGQPSGAKIAA